MAFVVCGGMFGANQGSGQNISVGVACAIIDDNGVNVGPGSLAFEFLPGASPHRINSALVAGAIALAAENGVVVDDSQIIFQGFNRG